LPEASLSTLNKAINVAKTSVADFAGGVDNLSNKFDRLAQTLRVSTYVELNSTYTKLVRNLALNYIEAEKLSKTVEILSRRTDTYSRQQLANMSATLYKSTGAITIFRGEFDKLTERFTNKYKKDAEAYIQTLTRLTEQMPEVAYSMKRGQSDFATLAEIMRTSGREGVSAYLASIDKIPDEVENSINKTEIQITRLQKIWDDAKVSLGRTLSTLYAPLSKAGAWAGGLAEQNPLKTGALGAVVSAGGMALSSFGPMLVQTKLLKNALGGGAKAAESLGGVNASNLWMPTPGNLIRHQGFSIASAMPSSATPQFAGTGRAILGAAGGAAVFAGGHALNDAYNGGGVWGQFGTNMAAGAATGSMFGAPGALIGTGVGAVGTVITELISVIRENTDALEKKERVEQEFKTDRLLARSKNAGYDSASQAVLNLSSKTSYGERSQAYLKQAETAKGQIADYENTMKDEREELKKFTKKQKQLEANKPESTFFTTTSAEDQFEAAMKHEMAVNIVTRDIEQKNKNINAIKAKIEKTKAEATEAFMQARISAERGITVSSALVGQTEQAMQLSIQYGGANVAGADSEQLKINLNKKIESLENKLVTVSNLSPEERVLTEQEIQLTKFALQFDPATRAAEKGFSAAALDYRSSMSKTGLAGATGSISFEKFVEESKTAELSQINKQIKEKETQLNSVDVTNFGEAAQRKRLEIEAEITELRTLGVKEAAKYELLLLEGAKAELQTRESIMKTYDVKSPELILKLQKDQLVNAKEIMEKEIKLNPERKAQLEAQFKAQAESVKYYENYGQEQAIAQQEVQIIQSERAGYGVLGADTKSLVLEQQIIEARSKLKQAEAMEGNDRGVQIAQAALNQLEVEKQITDEVEKRNMYIQKDIELTDIRLERMKTLRAPIGIIADLNRQGLNQEKEALKVAERKLEIAMQGNNEAAQLEARNEVERSKNKIASRLDFERRTYAEMFTETTFGKLGGGTYLFPNDVSKFAKLGSGYTTGQSGYGQKGGTYQTQIAEMFGAGVDEKTSIEKLYGSLVSDGIKLQGGTTFKITGIDNGVATVVKEADRP